jgi:DNA-binding transcriptional MerR regulator
MSTKNSKNVVFGKLFKGGIHFMEKSIWKIGEIAEKTGITIRTLHHYHDIGLLVPTGYTDVGHRIYSINDIIRLQQIISLKQFGFNLDKIKAILDKRNFDPLELVKHQLQIVEENIRSQVIQKSHLESILSTLQKKEAKTEEFIKLIGVINMSKFLLEVGFKLIPMVDEENGSIIINRIKDIRKTKDFPLIQIKDNTVLDENEYRIMINGKEVFRSHCNLNSEFFDENIETILKNLMKQVEDHGEEL